MIADFSTLTGSARSAVGAEIAAMFCNDDDLAASVAGASVATDDPVWRMPLHDEYNYMIDSRLRTSLTLPHHPMRGGDRRPVSAAFVSAEHGYTLI